MADRYELKTPRKGKDGKVYWTKVGVAFPQKNGVAQRDASTDDHIPF